MALPLILFMLLGTFLGHFLWYVDLDQISLYMERPDLYLFNLRWIPLVMAAIMSSACFLKRPQLSRRLCLSLSASFIG